jgi:hypothetical protein
LSLPLPCSCAWAGCSACLQVLVARVLRRSCMRACRRTQQSPLTPASRSQAHMLQELLISEPPPSPPPNPTLHSHGEPHAAPLLAPQAIRANHGGGYQYRLCPRSSRLTEECMQQMPVPFAGRLALEWQNGSRVEIPGRYLSVGTTPANSTWARMPLPYAHPNHPPEFDPPCAEDPEVRVPTRSILVGVLFWWGRRLNVDTFCRCYHLGCSMYV